MKGVDDVADAVEDVEDRLHDLTKEGSSSTDRMERDFKDLAKAADKASDEMRSKFRDAYRDVKRHSDDAMDAAKRGVDDFKDEASSTAREAAASFDGSADSIGDAFQEVAANAFAGFGPAGAVAGIAAAAGIGAAVAGFAAVDEANKKSQERIDEWVEKFIDGQGRIQEEAVLTGVQSMFGDPEAMQKVTAIIAATGLEQSTVMRALSGDIEDNRLVTESLTAARDALTDAQKDNLEQHKPYMDGLKDESQELLKAEDALKKHNGELDKATSQYGTYADALSTGLVRMAETKVAAGEASKAIDEFGDTVYTLPDGKSVYVDAETGQATQDLDEFNRIDLATKNVKVKVYVDKSDWDNWTPREKVALLNLRAPGGRQVI
ncbi:hypothetical protein [Microbacterium sp. SS28]|uniref:hypothetical protein n=1 Tax=Microbacterium sp. SS28 TaxID=2919948 RepID=UPI001FAAFF1A|nr:hypothetical protein [Microbacterium sp. SS28]